MNKIYNEPHIYRERAFHTIWFLDMGHPETTGPKQKSCQWWSKVIPFYGQSKKSPVVLVAIKHMRGSIICTIILFLLFVDSIVHLLLRAFRLGTISCFKLRNTRKLASLGGKFGNCGNRRRRQLLFLQG